jgi:hypothetical protein
MFSSTERLDSVEDRRLDLGEIESTKEGFLRHPEVPLRPSGSNSSRRPRTPRYCHQTHAFLLGARSSWLAHIVILRVGICRARAEKWPMAVTDAFVSPTVWRGLG